MSLQKLADEFLIYQHRVSTSERNYVSGETQVTYHRIPICGLCNNQGLIRLFADCRGKAEERPCICRNGRALKRGLEKKERAKAKEWAKNLSNAE